MVNLMKKASCKKLLSFYYNLFHILIKSLNLGIIRSCNLTCLSRYTQASFKPCLTSACL